MPRRTLLTLLLGVIAAAGLTVWLAGFIGGATLPAVSILALAAALLLRRAT